MKNNDQKHQVHNLIILDESGSMNMIKKYILQGFNELVQTMQGIEKQFPDQEHLITCISFNGLGQKIWHFQDPVSTLNQLDDSQYRPNASTPLFDAMGVGIHKLKQSLQGQENYNVLVTILTDGEENASMEYTGPDIKKLVEELKQNRWTFTYIGTDHDVDKMASLLSINNSMSFSNSERGIQEMFMAEKKARGMYSYRIQQQEDSSSDYYTRNI